MQTSQALKPPAGHNHISRLTDKPAAVIEGRVLATEERTSGGYRVLTDVRQVIKGKTAAKVSGKLLLYIKEGTLQARPGQIIRWRSTLRQPSRFGNPGEFNYPLHLAARGIFVTSFLNRAEDLTVLANHPAARKAYLENWRHGLATNIKEAVPHDAAGLLQSLLLGWRSGISAEQRQLLASSGVAHLFAISGLHFGLLALFLYQLGKWLYTRSQRLVLWCPPQRIIPVLLILPLAAYLLLTGNAWATQRAFLMATIVALLFAKGRRTHPCLLLSTVAFCLLLCNPLAGRSGSMVSGGCWTDRIGTLSPRPSPLIDRRPRWEKAEIASAVVQTEIERMPFTGTLGDEREGVAVFGHRSGEQHRRPDTR
jgi:competence protein ComEC